MIKRLGLVVLPEELGASPSQNPPLLPIKGKRPTEGHTPCRPRFSEVTAGFEPAIEVLQTPALPLGYVTLLSGAEDEIRTRDPLLGKEMLYR